MHFVLKEGRGSLGRGERKKDSRERRLVYILRERGGHWSVLNIGVISSDSSFLNIIWVYVRGVDFRVTRLEVERESVNCCRNPDGSDMGKGALS